MRELGYVDGKNVVIETRFGDSQPERLPNLVAELVRLRVDVIVATGSPVYRVLRDVNIPIVVTVTADPVIDGLAVNLARPGGNFTGLTDTATLLGPKHLELLRSATPGLRCVGVMMNPDNSAHQGQLQSLMLKGQTFGLRVVTATAATLAGIGSGFSSLARQGADAVILFGDTFFAQHWQQIAKAALKNRMPSIALPHEYVQAGGLMSYGPDFDDNFRRAASYVDKILKGAKPGEMPFQQPTRYVFAINRKTARALGLTVPQKLLLRADEVIE